MNYFEDILKTQRPIEQDGAWKNGLKHFFYFVFSLLSGMLVGAIFVAIFSYAQLDARFGNLKEEIGVSLFLTPIAFGITAYLIIISRQKHDKLGFETLFANGKVQIKFFLFGLVIYVIATLILNCFSVLVHDGIPKNFAQFITWNVQGYNEEFSKLSRFSPLGPNAYIYYLIALSISIFIQATTEEIIFRASFTQKFRQIGLSLSASIIISSIIFGLLHYEGGTDIRPIIALTFAGLCFCYVANRTQGIELGAGFHTLNNIYAFAIGGLVDNNSLEDIDYYLGFGLYFMLAILVEISIRLFPKFFERN
ncbi:MAG: CPBP family intramembrane metalloprotease [Caulobacterales bacterium]|nr:CPBP family intramembrane metalloprotease [Caulobacterales bacterium]MCA0371387.1 CPBP family intramembrane metalloprotease [Pseudomonadota bacterium]